MSALMNKVWNFFGMDTPESDMDLDGDDMYNQHTHKITVKKK